MKAQIIITWNPDAGEETKITYTQGWKRLHPIEQADNLKDALIALETKYNERLALGIVKNVALVK